MKKIVKNDAWQMDPFLPFGGWQNADAAVSEFFRALILRYLGGGTPKKIIEDGA